MKIFVIFAVLFGIAVESKYPTLKEEMIQKLDYCDGLINQGKLNATENGFNFYQKTFDNYLSVVAQTRVKVNALADNASSKVESDFAVFGIVVDVFNLVNRNVKEPFPLEHLKASVLYLSAYKSTVNETTESINLQAQVYDVIDLEILVSVDESIPPHTNGPINGDAEKLKEMYEGLRKSLRNRDVPSFEDQYLLIAKTQLKHAEYVRANRTEEAKKIEETIKLFKGMTKDLANLFPIDSKQVAQEYRDLAVRHSKLRITLLEIPHAEPTFRETLLNRLNVIQKTVDVAMVKYLEKGFRYYFDRLNEFRGDIDKSRADILRLLKPDDDDKAEMASTMIYSVNSLEKSAPIMIKNPSSETVLKSYALYVAAEQSKANASLSKQIYSAVEAIIHYQTHMMDGMPTGPSSFDKIARQAAYQRLQKMYDDLRKSLEPYDDIIRNQKDFEELMAKAEAKIKELEAQGHKDEADNLRKLLAEFKEDVLKLNQLLPLNDAIRIHQYYLQAQKTGQSYAQLSKLAQPVKESLLKRIEAQEKALLLAIAKYNSRSMNYYVQLLMEIQVQLNGVRDRVNKLHDKTPEKELNLVIFEVKDLELIVPSRAPNPSPYTQYKADALYLAAMKAKTENAAALTLIEKVTDIVVFEKHIDTLPTASALDKLVLQSAQTELNTKYFNLQQLMNGPMVVPTPEDNEKLVERANAKIKELTGKGDKVIASMLQNELNQFVGNERVMNQLLPIGETDVVRSYHLAANKHVLGRINVEALIAKH